MKGKVGSIAFISEISIITLNESLLLFLFFFLFDNPENVILFLKREDKTNTATVLYNMY